MSAHKQISWMFHPDRVQAMAVRNGLFSKEECQKIVDMGAALAPASAGVRDPSLTDFRKSSVAWVHPDSTTRWIFERISAAVLQVNSQFFGFDIHGLIEGLQFTEYVAPDGVYKAHVDRGVGMPVRKLSISIQLTDASTYKGGDLLLHNSAMPAKAPTEQGSAIIFPSYTLHEVTPVTEGLRHSLVCWANGPQFK